MIYMVYMGNIELASFIVSVLGVLTTILIGWNIYTVVDFKHRTKEIEELRGKLTKAIKLVDETGSISSSMLAERIADMYLSNKNIDEYISLKLFAITFYTKLHDYQSVSRISDEIEDFVNSNSVSNIALTDIVSYSLHVDDELTRQLLQKVTKLSDTLLNSQS